MTPVSSAKPQPTCGASLAVSMPGDYEQKVGTWGLTRGQAGRSILDATAIDCYM